MNKEIIQTIIRHLKGILAALEAIKDEKETDKQKGKY